MPIPVWALADRLLSPTCDRLIGRFCCHFYTGAWCMLFSSLLWRPENFWSHRECLQNVRTECYIQGFVKNFMLVDCFSWVKSTEEEKICENLFTGEMQTSLTLLVISWNRQFRFHSQVMNKFTLQGLGWTSYLFFVSQMLMKTSKL